MNENIDLTKILKDCPRGWKLYSSIHGEVQFKYIDNGNLPIIIGLSDGLEMGLTKDGKFYFNYDGECILFPSKDQRDWSKLTAHWCKKERFDPKTLKPFDKVLVRDAEKDNWECELFSRADENLIHKFKCCGLFSYICCIPYNDETKHLVGTNKEAPEYYRCWE